MTEERVWLGSYPEGVPADIDASQYPSLVGLMADSFAKYANRMAYSFMGQGVGGWWHGGYQRGGGTVVTKNRLSYLRRIRLV